MDRGTRALLRGCFFFSGATSLILEVAWSKQLSYILGNTLFAVSTVVAAFMAGLCLGSALISRFGPGVKRPIRLYATVQFGIAILGALSIPVLRATTPWFASLYQDFDPGQGIFLAIRFAVVFGLLLLPVVLMGMTLPLVVGAAARREKKEAKEAGALYGYNTLGAVAGTLAASYFLIPSIGIYRACLTAAGIDLIVCVIAMVLDRSTQAGGAPPDVRSRSWTGTQHAIGWIFGVSGVVAMFYEVAWFRILGLTLGPSVYAFASMLAIYLLGVGLGSVIASGWAERTRLGGIRGLVLLESLLGLTGLIGLSYLNVLLDSHTGIFDSIRNLPPQFAILFSDLAVSAILVLPPCLFMGALFPIVIRAVREAGPDQAPETNVGRVYLWNTAGAILGSLAAGFFLVPSLGVRGTLLLASWASIGIAVAATFLYRTGITRRGALLAGLPIVAGLVLTLLSPSWDLARFNLGLYRDLYAGAEVGIGTRGQQLVYHREGINAPVAVFRTLGKATLHVGGKPDASTGPGDILTQSLLGHLPLFFSKSCERVAVVGYGSGMTAGAVLTHEEVQRLDILEIEKAVMEASPYFSSINGDPLSDPRTRLIVEDGRIHLASTDEIYDVITSEPSNPWMAGVSNLFTVEFYASVRARLAPGGIFSQWIQNYDLSLDATQTLLASIHESFPHLVVFQPSPWDMIVLASDQIIEVPWIAVESRWAQPEVARSLRRANIRDPYQLAFFLVAPEREALSFAAEAVRTNTDDNAWIEHQAPYQMMLRSNSDPEDLIASAHELAKRGADHRVDAWGRMLPGVPLDPLLRRVVAFPHQWEPDPSYPEFLNDPWTTMRALQVPGISRSLRSSGLSAVADSVENWEAQGRRYRATRRQVGDALIQSRQARGSLSLAEAEQALTVCPDFPPAMLFLGNAAASGGDMELARRAFERVLLYPESSSIYYALLGLGGVAWSLGDIEGAFGHSDEAIRRNPYLPSAYQARAQYLSERGRREEALSTLEDGLRFNPRNDRLIQMRDAIE